jgi:putative polyhydroxyalkanoate system protein
VPPWTLRLASAGGAHMADISLKKTHGVDKEVLRGRLDELARDLKTKYGIRYRWDGDRCLLDGAGLKQGIVVISATELTLDVTLGMMARLLKPKIEEEINKKIGKVLAV